MERVTDLMVNRAAAGFSTDSTILIDMNFTCNGTIDKVIVTGRSLDNDIGNQSLKLQIWRKNADSESERKKLGPWYYRINEIALPSICEMNMLKETMEFVGGTFIYECTLNISRKINVTIGDILGLELPTSTDFELYSLTKCKLPSYVFTEHSLSSITDLNKGLKKNIAQPLIRVEVLNDNGDPGIMILHDHLNLIIYDYHGTE